MKTRLLSLLLFIPIFGHSQAAGSNMLLQADSLVNLSGKLTRKGEFDKALDMLDAAEKLILSEEAGIGQISKVYGDLCESRGRVYAIKGNLPMGQKWFSEAVAIKAKALGTDNSDYARSVHNLATLYWNMSDYKSAEPLYLESMAIREKVLGRNSVVFTESLNGLGTLYLNKSEYEKAEPLFLEALATRENIMGKDDPNYINSLVNLAILYIKFGNYEKAEAYFIETLEWRKKILGREHRDYIASLINMGKFYVEMGNYEKAEQFLFEGKTIQEETSAKENPLYWKILQILSEINTDIGNYEKAGLLIQEAIAIQGKALGEDHQDYGASLAILAAIYRQTGNYQKAEALYLEYTAITKDNLGNNNVKYAISLINLGNLYSDTGNFGKANALLLEGVSILEKTTEIDQSQYAIGLAKLALLYQRMGNHEQAREVHLRALEIYENALGEEQLDYMDCLSNLIHLYITTKDYDNAELQLKKHTVLQEKVMANFVKHLSERELNNLLNKQSENLNLMLSLAQQSNGKKATPICYDNCLFYKGFLLQSVGRIKQLALSDTAATEKHNRLKSCERRLAAQYAQPIAERDSVLIAQLETRANNLEKDLARTVSGWSEANRQVSWREVQQQLKKGEMAIEFVRYTFYGTHQTDSTMYAALLLRPDKGQPEFIPLFDERQLDSLLQSSGERKADYVHKVYALPGTGHPQKSLYGLIWQPLEKAMAGVNTIYYSPSGLLHRLNLGAVPVSNKETLFDRYRLVEMNSTRQLVIPSPNEMATQNAFLFGGIQYKMDSTSNVAVRQVYSTDFSGTRGEVSSRYADPTVRNDSWNYLHWTDKEVDEIATTLTASGIKTTTLKGHTATEESFKSIGRHGPPPRILHLATHGFFFPDPKHHPSSGIGHPQSPESSFKMSDHPMIRSGLILAGGNYAWKTGKPFKPDMDDGILTAYEISQMNLSNTELVVLSACETGLGDIQGNEGVYGLQRAFKIAGAKYLIMSLWQVPDAQTQELMTLFYQYWLEDKMSIPDAFRAAQKAMKERYLNPYFWAGFVLVE